MDMREREAKAMKQAQAKSGAARGGNISAAEFIGMTGGVSHGHHASI